MSTIQDEQMFNTMRTAILTAYPKIFTDIDYGAEIFFHAAKLATKYGFSFTPELFVAKMAVEIEARHKAVNEMLKRNLAKNTLVIELAAGLSPRRIEFADVDYLEVDYRALVEMKSAIYQSMQLKKYAQGLYAVDLSKREELRKFLSKIQNLKNYEKIIVVSEGLFWYLKREQIQGVLEDLSLAFAGLNWCWITADCPVEAELKTEYRKVIANSANINHSEKFTNYRDFCEFFGKHGYVVGKYKLADLVSPKNIYSGSFFSVAEKEIANRMNTYTDVAVIKSGVDRKI